MVWLMVRVEERATEVKEVVWSLGEGRRCKCISNGGWMQWQGRRVEVVTRVDAAVGWEANRSSNNNNGDSSSFNFQHPEQQQHQ